MRKAPTSTDHSGTGNVLAIPSVERMLSSEAFAGLIQSFGRERVKSAVVAHLDGLRHASHAYAEAAALEGVTALLGAATSSTLRRVINGTGVIIHTNLGRSPVDPRIWAEAAEVAAGYSNLEFDLDQGARGRREGHLTALCATLFGCEAAVLANNNAAGTLLLLAALAAKKEVLVSRGELVEIGGGFRVPDVIQQGGARLREVGTTNRTRGADYAAAASRRSAAILRVHRSNFDIVGFTETPSVRELVRVARDNKLPLLYDEGSGRVVDLSPYGFSRAETLAELMAAGVDAVTCSTDKLIGATQGGLILGRAEIVDKVRRHPLMRALRAGKESYAVIAATLRAFATQRHQELVPVYQMLSVSVDELRLRAADLIRGTSCSIVETRAALGGGTTPTETIPSIGIALAGNAAALQERFRGLPTPIIGRVEDDVFLLDLRTLLEGDGAVVGEALRGRIEN